jgi:uncharacterized membrane protein YdjX (TVP38/TMEM64 family)
MERDTLKLLSFLLFPILLVGLFYLTGLNDAFADRYRPAWEAWSDGHQWWASIVLFVVFAATSAAGIPRVYPAVLVGGLFSLPLAVAIAVGGAAAGSLIPFLAARRLGPPVVERKFGRRYQAWVQRINASGFSVVLLFRLFPGSNAMLVNMLCGISRIDTGKFFLATLTGIVPSTIAFVLLGSGLTRDHPVYVSVSVVTLLVLTVASFIVWRNIKNGDPSAPAGAP